MKEDTLSEETEGGLSVRSGGAESTLSDRFGNEAPDRYELSGRRRWAFVLFGVFYGLVALLSISDFSPSSVVGWLGLPILGLGSFHFLRAGLDSKPRFEFTSEGFVDRSCMGGGALHVRWEEIRGIEWTTFGGQLEISVRDPAKVRARAGWPRRFWMILGALYGKKTISIIPTASGPNLVELRARLDDRLFEFERSQLHPVMSDQLPAGAGSQNPRVELDQPKREEVL